MRRRKRSQRKAARGLSSLGVEKLPHLTSREKRAIKKYRKKRKELPSHPDSRHISHPHPTHLSDADGGRKHHREGRRAIADSKQIRRADVSSVVGRVVHIVEEVFVVVVEFGEGRKSVAILDKAVEERYELLPLVQVGRCGFAEDEFSSVGKVEKENWKGLGDGKVSDEGERWE